MVEGHRAAPKGASARWPAAAGTPSLKPSCFLFYLEHSLLEELACPELRLYRSLDLDLLARRWVAAFACCTLSDPKRTEARDRDFLAVAKGLYDSIENSFNRALSGGLCIDFSGLHNRFYQSFFVHKYVRDFRPLIFL